ncbi:DUF202 domain-containing protein [Pontibacter harenae]|uniref:DUF202 domain-containing protein n=1 Tax=Pontibacter harenae TaxID=2894083 RepID=UPI001E3994AE|nr:DUF202 domain-containing protein [Pontibacter harenae]MCC9165216.1 DUF202 domain-containing protein [Pontibacter harenae]
MHLSLLHPQPYTSAMGIREILKNRARKKLKERLKVQERLNLEIRDSLAMERTKMANERTLLAYGRTATAMVLAGLTFIKVFNNDPFYTGVGLVFVPIGLAIACFGYYRFSKKKKQVSGYTQIYAPTSPVLAEAVAQDEDNEKSIDTSTDTSTRTKPPK